MSPIKKTVYTALLIAVGIVLPITLHAIPNSGRILLPMHLPVLLSGIICGIPYGILCGIITPLLSGLLTSMPPAAMLPAMVCELAVYGLISALLSHFVHTKNVYANTFITLIGAMLAGRIVYGIISALVFNAGSYSMGIWMTSMFVTALPGIIAQLVLIPAIVTALQKSKLVEVYG